MNSIKFNSIQVYRSLVTFAVVHVPIFLGICEVPKATPRQIVHMTFNFEWRSGNRSELNLFFQTFICKLHFVFLWLHKDLAICELHKDFTKTPQLFSQRLHKDFTKTPQSLCDFTKTSQFFWQFVSFTKTRLDKLYTWHSISREGLETASRRVHTKKYIYYHKRTLYVN